MLPQPPAGLESYRAKGERTLCCPSCEKPMPLVGRGRVIRHPEAEKLDQMSFAITGWWCLFLLVSCGIAMGGESGLVGRFLAWGFVFLPALPSMVIFFLVRCFPSYRITECFHCGFGEMVRLTRKVKR